jgi:hypothetical protein
VNAKIEMKLKRKKKTPNVIVGCKYLNRRKGFLGYHGK